jgi:hypothetical protein
MTALVPGTERETRIDHAVDRIGYLVVSFGLLVIVAYRSFVNGEAAWDLIGLVILGGIVGLGYRAARQGLGSGRWRVMLVVTMGLAFIVAALVTLAAR